MPNARRYYRKRTTAAKVTTKKRKYTVRKKTRVALSKPMREIAELREGIRDSVNEGVRLAMTTRAYGKT